MTPRAWQDSRLTKATFPGVANSVSLPCKPFQEGKRVHSKYAPDQSQEMWSRFESQGLLAITREHT